jgi:hypothetical protein
MGALVLRVALLLSLTPSAVARMQATDVLALAWAQTAQETEQAHARDIGRVRLAGLVSLAMWDGKGLERERTESLRRAGLTPATVSAESFFATLDGGAL